MTQVFRVRPFVPAQSRWFAVSACLAVLLVSPPPTGAQDTYDVLPATDAADAGADMDWSDAIPAHVAIVDGPVQLERDGRIETAEENTPLLAGDRLRTDRGRVEIQFADGSVLDLDQASTVDLLSDAMIRLTSGRLRLSIARQAGALDYRVDATGSTVWIRASGEYDIALSDSRGVDPELRVIVRRGAAELSSQYGRTLIRTGFESRTTARTEPSLPSAASVASWDMFDRWADTLADERLGSQSARYLPEDLRFYGGAFDREGSWQYQPSYGYVWYPRVGLDWQPYYDGRWSYVGAFGWTWIGAGRSAWPTHHYGRWGNASGRWFWIPGRQWAPAWVSWASAPGYVGWCPLGFDNRPVIAITNISMYDSWSRRGWTILPSRSFTPGIAVSRYAAGPRTWTITPGSRFAPRAGGPDRPFSVRGDVAPLRGPGMSGRQAAVPRPSRTGSPTRSEIVPAYGPSPEGRSSMPRSAASGRVLPTGRTSEESSPYTPRTARPRAAPTDPVGSPRSGASPNGRDTPATPSQPLPNPAYPRASGRRAPDAPSTSPDRPAMRSLPATRSAPPPSPSPRSAPSQPSRVGPGGPGGSSRPGAQRGQSQRSGPSGGGESSRARARPR